MTAIARTVTWLHRVLGANLFRCGRLPTRNCPSSSLRAMRTQESEGNGVMDDACFAGGTPKRNEIDADGGYGSAMPRGVIRGRDVVMLHSIRARR